jgi:transcriptional regulator of met regulon
MSYKISTEIASNLRQERGLLLPTDRDYENSRVAEIAKRQQELMNEMNELDTELYKIFKEEKEKQ